MNVGYVKSINDDICVFSGKVSVAGSLIRSEGASSITGLGSLPSPIASKNDA